MPGEIPEQIFEALRDEELVIADLTGANPNVMYELGIRHVTGKCTLQVGETGRLPFDINTIRTVPFRRTPAGLIAARKKLNGLIGVSLANGCKSSIAARVMAFSATDRHDRLAPPDGEDRSAGAPTEPEPSAGSASDEGAAAIEATEEPVGLLDAAVELESSLPEMNTRMLTMTDLTEQIGRLAADYTEKLNRAQKPTQRLALVRAFGRELEPLAREYDQDSVEFDSRVKVVGLVVDTLIGHFASGDDVDGAEELYVALTTMGEAAKAAREDGLSGFYESLRGVENLSRDLRPVIRLLQAAVGRTIEDFSAVERWGQRAEASRVA